MSTRVSRKTTTTVTSSGSSQGTSEMSTPTGQKTQRSPSRARPPSPVMVSRVQEKEELAGLNDRLASYIDRMRFLENENKQLSTQIESHEETITREVTNIKALYENELGDARRLLDETSKAKARLQIENNKLKTENADFKDKNVKLQRDLDNAERRMLAAEAQVNELQARLNDAVNQRKHYENEYNKTKAELTKVSKQLDVAKKQLEDETVVRVDLENRVQSLKEELSFNSQVHEQELNETRTRVQVTLDETDSTMAKEYESRLADALRQMRAENDFQIRITREETQEVFEKKLDDLRRTSEDNTRISSTMRNELKMSRKMVDDLNSQLSGKDKVINQLEARVRQLEARLASELKEHESAIEIRDEEIARLKLALEEQLTEYRDLLDVKIALDMEIVAYRKLLESEETRLNISTASEATPRRRGTPMGGTPAKKRKRTTMGDEGFRLSAQSKAGYASTSTSKGAVEIMETDEEGKFIKLHNTGTKDVSLAAWQLKHVTGDEETMYKFHRSVHIKGGEQVTVYSSDSSVTHNPPADLVMKGQRWFVGDNMTSTLSDNKGKEMASRLMKKSQLRTTFSQAYTATPGGSSSEGDPQHGDEKCVIM